MKRKRLFGKELTLYPSSRKRFKRSCPAWSQASRPSLMRQTLTQADAASPRSRAIHLSSPNPEPSATILGASEEGGPGQTSVGSTDQIPSSAAYSPEGDVSAEPTPVNTIQTGADWRPWLFRQLPIVASQTPQLNQAQRTSIQPDAGEGFRRLLPSVWRATFFASGPSDLATAY